MTDRLADLHVHTTASDGALTPAQVVEAASHFNLTAVAITDHDTVGGVEEALALADEFAVDVIPGVEISTIWGDGVEVHILGYLIDHRDTALLEDLRVLKDARWERGRRMVELLNAAGVPVSFDRVLELAGGGAIGRPHIARAICEVGAVSSMDAAFGRFLQAGGPAYVPRFKVAPSEAVTMIREAGGVACCAHVAKLRRDELVVGLIKHGLQAIETGHPDHSSAARRSYNRFAARHGLIATGGSDAHGFPGSKRGNVGDVTVPYEVVEKLRHAAAAQAGNEAV